MLLLVIALTTLSRVKESRVAFNVPVNSLRHLKMGLTKSKQSSGRIPFSPDNRALETVCRLCEGGR